MPYPTSRLLLILLKHSDGTNLESNAGYMGSLYLNPRRHAAVEGICLRRPDLQPCVCASVRIFDCGCWKLLRVVSFLKCIWTFNFLFLKTVEVKVHFWSGGLSVYCETVNWWCSSHYRLTVWIQPVLKYFSEFIYLFIKGTCYMKRSCVWNTNSTPIFNAYFCVICFVNVCTFLH